MSAVVYIQQVDVEGYGPSLALFVPSQGAYLANPSRTTHRFTSEPEFALLFGPDRRIAAENAARAKMGDVRVMDHPA